MTAANETLKEIHDRMPVILSPENYDAWLNPENHDREMLQVLLQPLPDNALEVYPVSRAVNNPKNESGELLRREKENQS